jgi:hypothetical protein
MAPELQKLYGSESTAYQPVSLTAPGRTQSTDADTIGTALFAIAYQPVISPTLNQQQIDPLDFYRQEYGAETVNQLLSLGFTDQAELASLLAFASAAAGDDADKVIKELVPTVGLCESAGLTNQYLIADLIKAVALAALDRGDGKNYQTGFAGEPGLNRSHLLALGRLFDPGLRSVNQADWPQMVSMIKNIVGYGGAKSLYGLDRALIVLGIHGYSGLVERLGIVENIAGRTGDKTGEVMNGGILEDILRRLPFKAKPDFLALLVDKAQRHRFTNLVVSDAVDQIELLRAAGITADGAVLSLVGSYQYDVLLATIDFLHINNITDPVVLADQLLLYAPLMKVGGWYSSLLEQTYKTVNSLKPLLGGKAFYLATSILTYISDDYRSVVNIPAAVARVKKLGLNDPEKIAAFLIDIAAIAGNWTGYFYDNLDKLAEACRSLGLNILALTPAQQKSIFGVSILRFSKPIWTELVINRLAALDPSRRDSRPLALVIYPKSDNNGAYEKNSKLFYEIIAKGYRIMYYEAGTQEEFVSAFRAGTEYRRASLIIVGGHGSQYSTILGDGVSLNIGHERWLVGQKLATRVADDAVVILSSCSNGKGGKLGNNMANMWSRLLPGRKVFAAKVEFYAINLSWDKNRITDVDWFSRPSSISVIPIIAPIINMFLDNNKTNGYEVAALPGSQVNPPLAKPAPRR